VDKENWSKLEKNEMTKIDFWLKTICYRFLVQSVPYEYLKSIQSAPSSLITLRLCTMYHLFTNFYECTLWKHPDSPK
jgi:hypothetical protein